MRPAREKEKRKMEGVATRHSTRTKKPSVRAEEMMSTMAMERRVPSSSSQNSVSGLDEGKMESRGSTSSVDERRSSVTTKRPTRKQSQKHPGGRSHRAEQSPGGENGDEVDEAADTERDEESEDKNDESEEDNAGLDSETTTKDDNETYCVCKGRDDGSPMVWCAECGDW